MQGSPWLVGCVERSGTQSDTWFLMAPTASLDPSFLNAPDVCLLLPQAGLPSHGPVLTPH